MSDCGLTEKDLLLIMYQMLTLLEYFDRSGIVHRDLRPDNIMVVNNESEDA